MKPLYKEKISKRDIELLRAYECGLADGAGVEHEYRAESESFFMEKWARQNNVSIPKAYEIFSGKWNWDDGIVVEGIERSKGGKTEDER
jgi:hypothetical protein